MKEYKETFMLFSFRSITFLLVISVILLAFAGCGPGGAAGKYINHLNRIHALIRDHLDDPDGAGEAVASYVDTHADEIDALLLAMSEYTPAQTERAYRRVDAAIERIVAAIRESMQNEKSLGSSERLLEALSRAGLK